MLVKRVIKASMPLSVLFTLLCFGCVNAKTVQRFDLEGVLGSSLQVDLYNVSEQQAELAIKSLQFQANRLEDALSNWRGDSAISRLNQHGKLADVPQPLKEVVDLCQHWYRQSAGKFSCRLGKLRQKWQRAEQQQQRPDRVAMRYLARDIHSLKQAVRLQQGQLELADNVLLDVAGVAKGYIIDQLMIGLREQLPQASAIKLDIGGDILFWGLPEGRSYWQAALPNKGLPDDTTQVARQVQIPAMAIAASGHQRRYYQIEGTRFSHILQSAQGWPMYEAPSAVVLAKDAATADAVATTLCTYSATEGIDWVNQLEDVEAQITVSDLTLSSSGWHRFAGLTAPQSGPEVMTIDYQIPNIRSEKYHRPYLAMWVSDKQQRLVKQLLLLGESERWVKENRRWWHKVGRKTPALVDAFARPTRRPGHYQLRWHGLNNAGVGVTPGDYVLHMEAAREDGGHDYRKVNLVWGNSTQRIDLADQGELGKTHIELRSFK